MSSYICSLIHIIHNKTENSSRKKGMYNLGNNLVRPITKENIELTYKHMNGCSTSVIREKKPQWSDIREHFFYDGRSDKKLCLLEWSSREQNIKMLLQEREERIAGA